MLHPHLFVATSQIVGVGVFFYLQFDGVRFLAHLLFGF